MLVDVLCAVMSGAASGDAVRKWSDHSTEANLGQFFVALDPERMAPGMRERMQVSVETLIQNLNNLGIKCTNNKRLNLEQFICNI